MILLWLGSGGGGGEQNLGRVRDCVEYSCIAVNNAKARSTDWLGSVGHCKVRVVRGCVVVFLPCSKTEAVTADTDRKSTWFSWGISNLQ